MGPDAVARRASAGPVAVDQAEAHGDERSSARALRRARRERRRYERQEMRRFTARSRRRRLGWMVGVGSVAALVVLVLIAAYSPLMALREIRVEGASRVSAEEIVAAVDDQLGRPLPLVDAARVDEALSRFPLLESYSSESRPPGTLVIRVVERTPVGVLEAGGQFRLVDAAGVVLERAGERQEGYPLILVEGGARAPGFTAATSVIRSLPDEVRGQLVSVTAATKDDVRLELGGGTEVVWGSDADSRFKATVLAALLSSVPPDTVTGYDVSSPNSPVTF